MFEVDVPPTTKRTDYIEWEEYFMAVALLAAKRSKDPRTQVGACIVNSENVIVGIGYNGMPKCDNNDEKFPWARELKLRYVCHAELNAIVHPMNKDVKDCTIYVTLFPCQECAKIIVQTGIKNVIYMGKIRDNDSYWAAKSMFETVGVKFRQYKRITHDRIEICLTD